MTIYIKNLSLVFFFFFLGTLNAVSGSVVIEAEDFTTQGFFEIIDPTVNPDYDPATDDPKHIESLGWGDVDNADRIACSHGCAWQYIDIAETGYYSLELFTRSDDIREGNGDAIYLSLVIKKI